MNDLLRRSTVFDEIFDFDSWAKDPADESRLNPKGGSEDKLHPGIEGGKHWQSRSIFPCFAKIKRRKPE